MWPLFIGVQVVKTVLLVLFLPSIIGSVGKIAAKGLPSLSGTFSHLSQPGANVETVDDLEFKDNSLGNDHDTDGTYSSAYQYNIPAGTGKISGEKRERKKALFETFFFFFYIYRFQEFEFRIANV